MSNCINSGVNKIFVLTLFNSASLNRHMARTYFGNGVNFGDGFVEVLAATQTLGEAGMNWFQGTADAVRKFMWVFEVWCFSGFVKLVSYGYWITKNKDIGYALILSGDHLYRTDYMDLVQNHVDRNADITVSRIPVGDRYPSSNFMTRRWRSACLRDSYRQPRSIDQSMSIMRGSSL